MNILFSFNLITGRNKIALYGFCLSLFWLFPTAVKSQVLFDNGPISNGTNSSNQPISELYTTSFGMGTIGFGHQLSAGNRIADDFTITGTWQIDSIVFFAYQTGSTTTSTITNVNFRIWDSVPINSSLANVVFGDSSTNRLSATRFSGAYRVTSASLTNTTRPIMRNVCGTSLTLTAGTYWVDWQSNGSLASGPWAPPRVPVGQNVTGNGRQRAAYTCNNALDGGTGAPAQGFPFIIYGTDLAPTFTTNPSNTSVCSNATATLSVVATASPTAYQWEENTGSGWTPLTNGGVYSNVTTANLTITNPDTMMDGYQYRCIATNAFGFNTSTSAILTVSASGPAPTMLASNNTPCAGTQVTLTATPPSGYTAAEYLWYKNGVAAYYQNGGSGTYTVNAGTTAATNDYSVKIVYTSTNACLSEMATSTVVTTQAPNATITPAGPTTFCANNPTTLNATAGMNTYLWRRGSTVVGTNSASYIPVLSGNHNVTVTDANGCSRTSPWVNITRNTLPTANAGADRNVCIGSSVQIGSTNNMANSYDWDNGAFLNDSTISNPIATPTTTTTYTVTVTNNTTGCSNSDQVVVNVLSLPATPSVSKTVSGTTATLTPTAPGVSSINWYRDGSLFSSNRPAATAINVAVSNPAKSYTIRSRGSNGCLSEPSMAVTARNGNDKDGDLVIELANDIMTAYPNPTQGELQVNLKGVNATSGTLFLYNAIGQVVLSQAVELVNGEANLNLDLTSIAAGVYSLSFENEVVKIVKE